MLIPLLFASALASSLAAAASTPTQTFDYHTWGASVDTFTVSRPGERFTLAHAFVVPGSDSVTAAGVPLALGDYRINYHMGMVWVDVALAEGTRVVVRYRRYPVLVDPVYALREMETSARTDTAEAERRPRREAGTASEPPTSLVFGGTKSVSFTLGSNRGTQLDQTLQATVEGQLTPTIKVRAILSDNNLPIQPEGNTTELEYFDQVLVEVEGTNGKVVMGDFTLENKVSTFSPLTRQLKGASGSAWVDRGRVNLAGATSKGVFTSREFRGTTGIQGPYELLSAGRNTGEVVIAGTERVYVDGRRLVRGENQDYTIDYDRGSITFTPKRLITRDSEISVDFEVSQERYSRSAVLASAEQVDLGSGVKMAVAFAREADDPDRPRNVSFDDDDRAVLRDAGDNPDRAVTGGVTPVPVGEGEYVLLPADTIAGLPDRYVFDDTTGNFLVLFVEVGLGDGDYELGGISARGRRYYRYVGTGLGSYVVGKQLPLPEKHEVVTARVTRASGDHLTFDAEWNVSDRDRNRFSPLDDADNVGDAGRAVVTVKDIPAGVGRMSVAGEFSTLEDRFQSFDRARPQFYYRDWNLENVPLAGRELVGEGRVELAPNETSSLRYALGRMDRDDFDGVKHEAGISAGTLADRGVDVRGFDTRTDSDSEKRSRTHVSGQGAFGLWRVVPSFTYAAEEYLEHKTALPDSGQSYRLYRARLSNRNPQRVTLQLEAEERNTDDIDAATGQWRDARRDRTVSAVMSARGGGPVQGDAQFTHSEQEDLVIGGTTTTDLARLAASLRIDRWALRSDVDYEISQNAARVLERSVVFVGEGQGDYNELGEEVGKGKGDFALVYSPTTTTLPTQRADFSIRTVWKPRGEKGGGVREWIARNVSLDQTVAVKEETTYEPAWKVFVFVPSALQRDDATLLGSSSLRQDWSFLRDYANISLTLRYLREDTEDNRFEGVRENRFSGEHVARLQRSLSERLTATLEGGRATRRRGGVGIPAGTGSRYDIVSWSGLLGLGVRLSPGSTLDVDAKTTRRTDDESGAKQTVLTLGPRLVWKVTDIVNVFSLYELSQVWDSENTLTRPLLFAREGSSHRWNVSPTIRLSNVLSFVATYTGRRETTFTGARITDHELRLETRAFF